MNTSTLWATMLIVAAVSVGIKAAGPALLGDRALPAWTSGVIAALAPALLVVAVTQPIAGVVFVLDGVLMGAGDGPYLAGAMLVTLAVFAPVALLVPWAGGGLTAL